MCVLQLCFGRKQLPSYWIILVASGRLPASNCLIADNMLRNSSWSSNQACDEIRCWKCDLADFLEPIQSSRLPPMA